MRLPEGYYWFAMGTSRTTFHVFPPKGDGERRSICRTFIMLRDTTDEEAGFSLPEKSISRFGAKDECPHCHRGALALLGMVPTVLPPEGSAVRLRYVEDGVERESRHDARHPASTPIPDIPFVANQEDAETWGRAIIARFNGTMKREARTFVSCEFVPPRSRTT